MVVLFCFLSFKHSRRIRIALSYWGTVAVFNTATSTQQQARFLAAALLSLQTPRSFSEANTLPFSHSKRQVFTRT
jgi:hypothetical protein